MPLIPKAEPEAEISETHAAFDFDAAIDQLEFGTPEERRMAALTLREDKESHPVLAERLLHEPVAAVRHAIYTALARSQNPLVLDAMIAVLRIDDAARRNEAVSALQNMPRAVAARMADLMQDKDPDVRIMAIDVLRLLPSPDAPRWLRGLLKSETHHNVIGVAVDRLAEIGGVEDLETLKNVKAKWASDPYLNFATGIVIKRIETQIAEGNE